MREVEAARGMMALLWQMVMKGDDDHKRISIMTQCKVQKLVYENSIRKKSMLKFKSFFFDKREFDFHNNSISINPIKEN